MILRMFAEIDVELSTALPFVLHTVGCFERQPPVTRPQGFEAHEFLWVREGRGSFFVRGETFTLEKGEGVFFRKDVPRSYEGKDFSTSWCTFFMSDEALDYLGVTDWMRYTVPPHLDRELDTLHAFANGSSTVLSRSAAGYQFVTDLFGTILASKDSVATRILRFLEHRYGDPLTLDEIAAEAGMDRFAFCRYYTQARGVSVMEDLFRIRIAKSKRLLKYSTDTVESVGKMCGFDSPSYFGKRFREAVGCTPAEYRRRANGEV